MKIDPIDKLEFRSAVEAHWKTANARDWTTFASLLHPGLRYEVPQTREYIEGGEGYVEMFRTWPGDWIVDVKHLVCEQHEAICVIDFLVDGETMTGISIFQFSEGLISHVTDYWPAPYTPPVRATSEMKRRPG